MAEIVRFACVSEVVIAFEVTLLEVGASELDEHVEEVVVEFGKGFNVDKAGCVAGGGGLGVVEDLGLEELLGNASVWVEERGYAVGGLGREDSLGGATLMTFGHGDVVVRVEVRIEGLIALVLGVGDVIAGSR